MDHVEKRSCEKRFEARLSAEHARKLAWLTVRLSRSGNGVVRAAIDRMYEEEQRVMLIQAGFPNGKVP